MQVIRNIIFDLGGVFLNIDYHKTEQAFIDLGVKNFDHLFTFHHSTNLFEELETGKISPEIFFESFRTETGLNITDEQIEHAWNAMLLGFPKERLEWLENISMKYNIYLFSNTNAIHVKRFHQMFNEIYPDISFSDYFIRAYYSNELGMRKPYPESFRAILEKEDLAASETLFIDDTSVNIEGAREVGLNTIHLVQPLSVLNLDL